MDMTKHDRLETLPCGSLVQHGQYNDRVYLMKATDAAAAKLPKRLIGLAQNQGYGKIFAKIPLRMGKEFETSGFLQEARVPGFFNGSEDALFMAYYLDDLRAKESESVNYENIMKLAKAKRNSGIATAKGAGFSFRRCQESDVSAMAKIYQKVFASYPFPIHESDYLLETMRDAVDYFCAEKEGVMVALASAEKYQQDSNWEMTDFATLPKWRGHSLGVRLLDLMENEAVRQNVKTVYTIARAASAGMNITFARLGYHFGGRLKNNTNISGQIESMNVWYKSPEK
ncbi:MAG: putative beta-lysine N-acetyltransferase [Victivallaceae bacterium]|nr:putative beta-lysine N-acetyltransferase [Victivallaceae bacterium]MDD3703040.1 putative beta-lysine N-acetyltransferase [Victivallaceae bacterium]MDD4316908.1 putative beta-lysine N-acetyltransferase [Victivallaceae bacterium]MDD5664383.1 putative beta-lysine N-acetyltransferase [Victivallaceae bacterium]